MIRVIEVTWHEPSRSYKQTAVLAEYEPTAEALVSAHRFMKAHEGRPHPHQGGWMRNRLNDSNSLTISMIQLFGESVETNPWDPMLLHHARLILEDSPAYQAYRERSILATITAAKPASSVRENGGRL